MKGGSDKDGCDSRVERPHLDGSFGHPASEVLRHAVSEIHGVGLLAILPLSFYGWGFTVGDGWARDPGLDTLAVPQNSPFRLWTVQFWMVWPSDVPA